MTKAAGKGNGASKKNELALLKDSTVGAVEKRIAELTSNHQLTLPSDYSVGNALQAAWLALQEVKDKNGGLAIETCTRNSIVQALFSMCVQALDPGKKHGYFIAYGQQLAFQRSYFGTLAVGKRMADTLAAEEEIDVEAREYANREVLDVGDDRTIDMEDFDQREEEGPPAGDDPPVVEAEPQGQGRLPDF